MIALYVQTLVLLGLAYLAGACLACIVRRSLFKPAVAVPAGEPRVDPLPEFANRTAVIRATPAASAPVAVAAVPAPVLPPQDLKRIRLIDEALERTLAGLGVTRYEHIAAWTATDVTRIAKTLVLGERISQENWIEQAQILAKGGETDYARRRARGEIATAAPGIDEGSYSGITPTVIPALAMRPQASTAGASAVVAEIITSSLPRPVEPASPPTPLPAAAAAPAPAATTPDVAMRAAFAVEHPRVAVPIRPAPSLPHDDFLRIGHIDDSLAKALGDNGVTRYAQLAQWSPADVERFETLLGASGRIARENWVEQAQILSRGGDTAFSRQYDRQKGIAQPLHPAKLADAIRENAAKDANPETARRRSDISGLRSVRSDAFQGETAEAIRPPRLRTGAPEDLKRIRGIGVLIEKKLNSMGINSYETIANWTATDIDRVSQTLDFKGRIERENWVEQARILSSGGATEFSRRVDRGEVETSRPRS